MSGNRNRANVLLGSRKHLLFARIFALLHVLHLLLFHTLRDLVQHVSQCIQIGDPEIRRRGSLNTKCRTRQRCNDQTMFCGDSLIILEFLYIISKMAAGNPFQKVFLFQKRENSIGRENCGGVTVRYNSTPLQYLDRMVCTDDITLNDVAMLVLYTFLNTR